MLNFDTARFIGIQSQAVAIAEDLRAAIGGRLEAGATNLFFLGAGGVTFLMQPAYRMLSTASRFPVYYEMAAELVEAGNVNLSENSIVVMPSLSGTTAEAVAALDYVKKRGAYVISLTGHADTPIAEGADRNFTTFAEDDTSSELFYLQTLLATLSVLDARGEIEDYEQVVGELALLPELLVETKAAFEDRAREVAEFLAASDYHIITGAGSVWPEAHYYGMCILEEMQWIRTRPVHASDFFHGALELVEQGVSVVVFTGEDDLRPLSQRVATFAEKMTDKMIQIDTASLQLSDQVSPRTRALISPVLLATVLERVSAHLEQITDHPLTTRRYYKKMDY
jgi:fructoselysine-6-phosphate deglycase